MFGWGLVLLSGRGTPGLYCTCISSGLGLHGLWFRLVVGVPPTHHLAGRMILCKISGKNTPLPILQRLFFGSAISVAFLLPQQMARCVASVQLRT